MPMQQTELLIPEEKYPDAPGFAKKRGTSRKAASKITNLAGRQCEVFMALRRRPMTDHELADHLHLDVCQVQPRRSELTEMGRVVDSGDTRMTKYNRSAIVWQAVGK